MKFRQTFALGLVALSMAVMGGCAHLSATQTTGLDSASPITQALQAPASDFAKRAQ